MKSFILTAAFLFSVSGFASTVEFNCKTSSDTISGVISDNGTATVVENGQNHSATGTYKVYEKGSYCAQSDVVVLTVFADDHSVGVKSVQGDTCGGNNGDLVVLKGHKQVASCEIHAASSLN